MRSLSFFLVQFRYCNWQTAARGNPRESCGRCERDDNVSIVTPTASRPTARRVAQAHRSAACDRDFLEFSIGEECDPLTVSRKERLTGAVGAREERGLILIQRTERQAPALA